MDTERWWAVLQGQSTGQWLVFGLGVVFAIAVGRVAVHEWAVDLRRLLWAGRLTRSLARQGLSAYRDAARRVPKGVAAEAAADAEWDRRAPSQDEIAARLALWLLSQPWHDGDDRELRWDGGWVFVTRSNALRLVSDRRSLLDLFERIRRENGDLEVTRATIRQLVPEVGGRLRRNSL